MDEIQAGRLLTLAWFLKTQVPRRHFDMASFYDDPEGESDRVGCENLSRHKCGTSACALGWAPVALPDDFRMQSGIPLPVDPVESSYSLFGLEEPNDWSHLFGGEHIRTPKQEAKVIENFVRERGWVYA